MVCPTGCTCLANTFTFNAYNDGVTDSTAPHVLYASATQRLTVTDPSWPAEGAALQAQINGPPQSLYVKVLPISLAGGCCTGAVSDATHAGPTYGGAATAGSSGPAGIMLSLPTNTYKICVASGRSTPPFSDTDYLMSANTVLTVFSNQPPPPPLPPPSPLPPIMPPPSLPPRAPPTPPPPPPFPLFSALTAEGSGLDECAFAPPPGSALPPPPALPPQPKAPPQMPPEPFTPGPLYPPSPSAPPEPPPFCVTMGLVVLFSVSLFLLLLVLLCCRTCKRTLDAVNCGPAGLAESFDAIRTVPTNAEVGTPKGLEKIKVTFFGEGLKLQIYVQLVCGLCCLALFGGVGAAIIGAATSGLASAANATELS